MRFLLSHRLVLNTLRDYDDFPLSHRDISIPELHEKLAFDDQEQFVLILMMMPFKFALDLCELHIGVV